MTAITPSIPRVALVTGAAQRIGRAIALALDGGQHLQWQSGRHGPPPQE